MRCGQGVENELSALSAAAGHQLSSVEFSFPP